MSVGRYTFIGDEANLTGGLSFQTVMNPSDLLSNVWHWVYRYAMSRGGEQVVPVQSGALPWRMKRSKKKVEVMLVTGRRSGRWMIPKGWPMDGKSLADSAAQEAFEEAGIKGRIEQTPIGAFRHVKQHLLLGRLEVDILVHTLAVERELGDWPEKGERNRKWFALEDAAARVDSIELKTLIVEFGRTLKEQKAAAKQRKAEA
jgi:8-oxo-dGTP pyrophosphatase MutT (NUDIX family)